jgi:hypothetical protein
MAIRHQAGVIAGVLLTCGISMFAPAVVRAQGAFALPEKGATVTVAGCLGIIDHDDFVIASPTMDAVQSVPTATCAVTGPMIRLKNVKRSGLNKQMVGRYLEVSGTVGSAYDEHPDRIRRLHMSSYRFIPVERVITKVVMIPSPPVARAEPVAPVVPQMVPQMEQPVGTTGTVRRTLPKTASSLPLVGLIGLASLAGGLTLHVFGRRRFWM